MLDSTLQRWTHTWCYTLHHTLFTCTCHAYLHDLVWEVGGVGWGEGLVIFTCTCYDTMVSCRVFTRTCNALVMLCHVLFTCTCTHTWCCAAECVGRAKHTPLNPDRRRNWSWELTLPFRVPNRCQISCRSYHRHSQCKLPYPKWRLISDIGK